LILIFPFGCERGKCFVRSSPDYAVDALLRNLTNGEGAFPIYLTDLYATRFWHALPSAAGRDLSRSMAYRAQLFSAASQLRRRGVDSGGHMWEL
jgi:hypothetical protein